LHMAEPRWAWCRPRWVAHPMGIVFPLGKLRNSLKCRQDTHRCEGICSWDLGFDACGCRSLMASSQALRQKVTTVSYIVRRGLQLQGLDLVFVRISCSFVRVV
jgi:hypothetical protein